MIIGVMTDLHLGHRQYGSIDREKDFYIQLQKCVNKLNEQCCDIVIIAGDIFDKANPSPEAMHQYNQKISDLNANTILATKGNHTMLLRHNHFSVDEFFADNIICGYHLLEDESWNNLDVWVDGITYRGNSQLDDFISVQHDLAAVKDSGDVYRILVIHQAVSEFCGFMGEDLSIKDFDTNPYNIIICGHIHSRLYKTLDDGTIFLQPGSIERLNTTEARDELKNQKGVWTIDTETEEVNFHYVPQERIFLMDSIDIKSDKDIETHKKEVLQAHEYFDVAPVIAYEYHDYVGNRAKINDMIIDIAKDALLSNCNIYDETIEEDIATDTVTKEDINVNSLIKQKKDLTEEEQQLAIDIYNAFKKNEETVGGLLEDFKEKNFNQVVDTDIEQELSEIEELEQYFENL